MGGVLYVQQIAVCFVSRLDDRGVRCAVRPSEERPAGRAYLEGQGSHSALGTGESARLKVELYDDTKLAGSIVGIGDDQFVLHDARTGKNTEIAYSAVKRLKGNAPGLARTIALGAGAFQSKRLSLSSPLWLRR
jgi:hypothetical protein